MSHDYVLVSGAAGFIGHHLVQYFLDRTELSIIALDRFDQFSACKRFDDPRVATLVHDLQNPLIHAGVLADAVESIQCVINLAADSHVDRSIFDPIGFVKNNVISAANMLEYTRRHLPHVKFLQMSTDEVYGAAGPGQVFDEGSRFFATNPYSASKVGAEALMPAYANTYGMSIAVVRATNIYGRGQHSEKFMPMVCERLLNGLKIYIHSREGVPSSRMYLHTSDVCRAIHLIMDHGDTIDTKQPGLTTGFYNVGGAFNLSNLDVAQEIADQLGKLLSYELVEDPPNRPRPDMRYSVSCDRLWDLGWRPRVTLEAGIRDVVAPYLAGEAA